MSLSSVFDIASSGMNAQTLRMNTLAGNVANADTLASSADDTYRAQYPVFKAVLDNQFDKVFNAATAYDPGSIFNQTQTQIGDVDGGVSVDGIYQSDTPPEKRYYPSHPLADEEGYVYVSNVNIVEEMADMISASRSFEINAQVANTAKSMMQRLITLGR